MNGLHLQILPVQCPAYVHEAAVVESRAVFRAGCQQISELRFKHGGGHLGVLHREGATESAAAIEVCDGNELEASDFAE